MFKRVPTCAGGPRAEDGHRSARGRRSQERPVPPAPRHPAGHLTRRAASVPLRQNTAFSFVAKVHLILVSFNLFKLICDKSIMLRRGR